MVWDSQPQDLFEFYYFSRGFVYFPVYRYQRHDPQACAETGFTDYENGG